MAKSLSAAEYIETGLVLSDSEAWAVLKLHPFHTPYTSAGERVQYAQDVNRFFVELLRDFEDGYQVHLQTTSTPFDIESWSEILQDELPRDVRGNTRQKTAWPRLLEGMHGALSGSMQSDAWLSVRLGGRKTAFSGADIIASLRSLLSDLAGGDDNPISTEEMEHWRELAARVGAVASSFGLGEFATAREVAWLVAHPINPDPSFTPTSSVIPAASANALALAPIKEAVLFEADPDGKHKFIPSRKVTIYQEDMETGEEIIWHSTTLMVTALPDNTMFPQRASMIDAVAVLPFPAEWSIRGEVMSPDKTRTVINRKRTKAKDLSEEAHKSGMGDRDGGITADLQVLNELKRRTETDAPPMFFRGYASIRVSAEDEKELRQRIHSVQTRLGKIDVSAKAYAGEQVPLLGAAMPGNKQWGSKREYFVTDIEFLGTLMLASSGEVGDRNPTEANQKGPYIGYTTSRVKRPTFLSPHMAIRRNSPPTIAITGEPGGGKSFSAFSIAYNCAAQGIMTIFIDPKGDAKPLGQLKALDGAKVFDLRDGHAGMLDPFSLAEDAGTKNLLALETLKRMIGTNLSEAREGALNHAIEVISSQPNPSLNKVVDFLLAGNTQSEAPTPEQIDAARNLGSVLKTLRELPFAKLCFAENSGMSISPEDGLTVITLLGLNLPSNSDNVRPEDYSLEERLSVAVMYLLTKYCQQLMLYKDKNFPKMLFIDEAWAITRTQQGRRLIEDIARMGRSHNTALAFVSQNVTDITQDGSNGLRNSVSTWMCFGVQDQEQIEAIQDAIGASIPLDSLSSTMRGLRKGECIMRDVDRRISRVQIDAFDRDLFEVFNTNPWTRKAEHAQA